MNKFDSIRPYNDNEVNDVLSQLSSNRRFLKMLFATGKFNQIRYFPFSRKLLSLVLKNRIKNINDVNSYQNLFEGIVSGIVQQSINKFSVEGIKNLDSEKGYLYISNHRDITLDSALLNLTLHQNNLKTTYNAVGNNLLSEKWASDLMRLNKSFIIDRSDKSKRDIYKSLNLASEFIFNAIKNKNESVWIAQKQGRSKDGNDYTDPSVIKMIHLNSRKKIPVDQAGAETRGRARPRALDAGVADSAAQVVLRSCTPERRSFLARRRRIARRASRRARQMARGLLTKQCRCSRGDP